MRKTEETPHKKNPPKIFSFPHKKKKPHKILRARQPKTPVGDVKRTPHGTIEENIEEAAP